jgi:uncharacterized protein (TIGR03084 family)
MTVFDDLEAEQDRLSDVLAALDDAQWGAPSLAQGWNVRDVVVHLAQGEELLRAADPQRRIEWAAAPLKPAALATTRLAEHWTHGLDITAPLGIGFPDTDRLRHVAWLAHRMLPYAYGMAGEPAAEVRAELTTPDGTSTWEFGPPEAASKITGDAGAFCRVAAQRLAPAASGLRASGPDGARALALIRSYAV